MQAIASLAKECAAEAIEAAGSEPTDDYSKILLPIEPMSGDWDALEEELGCKPDEGQMHDFAYFYREVMQAEIDRLTVVQRIKQAISDAGMSQAEVARQCGWDRRAIDQRLKAKSPSLETLKSIAKVLEMTVSELIGE